jgi:plasmid maintenance system antidote protein VapI
LALERQRQVALERGDLAHAEELDRETAKKRGPKVDAMERKGDETERGNIYRDMAERAALPALKANLPNWKSKSASSTIPGEREAGFRPEMAVRLSKVFGGSAESRLVRQAQYDLAHVRTGRLRLKRRFRAAAREGIAQADRGEFIEEAEMDARLEQMLRS